MITSSPRNLAVLTYILSAGLLTARDAALDTNAAQQPLAEQLKSAASQHKLVYTAEELKECEYRADLWPTTTDLLKATITGHRGAAFLLSAIIFDELQTVGNVQVSQVTQPFEVFHHREGLREELTTYLAISASLGFAPALDKIRLEYLHGDSGNLYLHLVYTNLCVELGHTELIPYLRDALEQIATLHNGKQLLLEIDRITREKLAIIKLNENTLKASSNPFFVGDSIAHNDSKYTMDYWMSL